MGEGILLLAFPVCLYLGSLPITGKLWKGIRISYIVLGSTTVFGGGGVTMYLALYTGDQGGIAAAFFRFL